MFLIFAPSKLSGHFALKTSPKRLSGGYLLSNDCSSQTCLCDRSILCPPSPWGLDLHLLPPTPRRSSMGALRPSRPPAGPPHLPKKREKPTAPKPLQNYSAVRGAQASSQPDLGYARAEQGGSRRICYLPTEPKLPSDCRSFPFFFHLFFFNFCLSFSFFLTWPPKQKEKKAPELLVVIRLSCNLNVHAI